MSWRKVQPYDIDYWNGILAASEQIESWPSSWKFGYYGRVVPLMADCQIYEGSASMRYKPKKKVLEELFYQKNKMLGKQLSLKA